VHCYAHGNGNSLGVHQQCGCSIGIGASERMPNGVDEVVASPMASIPISGSTGVETQ